jgi:hypothetical protein
VPGNHHPECIIGIYRFKGSIYIHTSLSSGIFKFSSGAQGFVVEVLSLGSLLAANAESQAPPRPLGSEDPQITHTHNFTFLRISGIR